MLKEVFPLTKEVNERKRRELLKKLVERGPKLEDARKILISALEKNDLTAAGEALGKYRALAGFEEIDLEKLIDAVRE